MIHTTNEDLTFILLQIQKEKMLTVEEQAAKVSTRNLSYISISNFILFLRNAIF